MNRRGVFQMYKATVHFETVVEAKAFVTASNEVDFKVCLLYTSDASEEL